MIIDPVTLREVIVEEMYLIPLYLHDVDCRPVLDDTGNPIRDETGAVIFDE